MERVLLLVWTQINLAVATGSYPHPGDVECYDYELTLDMVKKLISQSNEIALKQVFGPDFKSKKPEEVTLLEALELKDLLTKLKIRVKKIYMKVK